MLIKGTQYECILYPLSNLWKQPYKSIQEKYHNHCSFTARQMIRPIASYKIQNKKNKTVKTNEKANSDLPVAISCRTLILIF
jgi:hypothetical protein